MVNNRITEGVGRKIVEALKQQNDIEITPIKSVEMQSAENFTESETEETLSKTLQDAVAEVDSQPAKESAGPTFNFSQIANPQELKGLSSLYTAQAQPFESVLPEVEEMELPANVAVLRQLITQLPSGVSKQTGAMIIKQTMEALGISMNTVLQEAQQVQESLNQSSRECQNSILEYRKQINVLEAKTQKYNKQFAAVNDIISLFVQTN